MSFLEKDRGGKTGPIKGLVLLLTSTLLICPAVFSAPGQVESSIKAPWREAGLSEKEAAAHILDRLAFGARPGEVERVAAMGVDRWLEEQILETKPEPTLDEKLARFKSLELSAQEISERYPNKAVVLRMAVEAGIIEDPEKLVLDSETVVDDRSRRGRLAQEDRRKVLKWARDQGFGPQREVHQELTAQKLLRARYAENQLQEVLADFWFNHFNVPITDPLARIFVLPYEREAIRPFVLGGFRDMLEATAKDPAMLFYLDNANSVADDGRETTIDSRLEAFGRRGERMRARLERRKSERGPSRPSGLNENYARELLELHTLGVDGGYTQEDVIEVARAFTGWTTLPPSGRRPKMAERVRRMERLPEAGFIVEDAFIFRADAHDAGDKVVLGHRLRGGRGIEDGLEVLDILAAHPSTARHVASKLAIRFVADAPPAKMVDRLAEVFEKSDGDLRRVMVALVESPEFWARSARGAKIKSPFELATSSLRALGAEIFDSRLMVKWVERMGQPLYAYQAPTGYPDRAEAWVNTGALLHRMNFGLELATGRVSGVRYILPDLGGGLSSKSIDEALEIFVPFLLPERDTQKILDQLRPITRDPLLARRIQKSTEEEVFDMTNADTSEWEANATQSVDRRIRRIEDPVEIEKNTIAHVIGVILGSPEFQRR